MTAHFHVPLDLPHAARVASRIASMLERQLGTLETAEASNAGSLHESASGVEGSRQASNAGRDESRLDAGERAELDRRVQQAAERALRDGPRRGGRSSGLSLPGLALGRRRLPASRETALQISEDLVTLLWPYHIRGSNPPDAEARLIRSRAADHARELVRQIEELELGHDRLGQRVRNLFECLELGVEGAIISLLAGENPDSLQRPG